MLWNCELRTLLLKSLDPDFISLNETHLCSDTLDLDGFTWFGHNRIAHKRAVKASGGVRFLIKNAVLERYSVGVVDKTFDGIFCLCFVHKELQYSFILISCYLSRESSTWGRNADLYFGHLLALLYTVTDTVDSIYICGDFNSWTDYAEDERWYFSLNSFGHECK